VYDVVLVAFEGPDRYSFVGGLATRMIDLAEALGMTAASASALIDRMVQRGFVTRRSDPDDRRTVLVELSRRGQRILDIMERGSSDHFTRMIEKMTPSERDALATTLRAFLRIGAELGDGKTRKC